MERSREVASRVAFSYESMMYTAEWLVWKGRDETVELGMWNAHVDSFLVHARRLHDLLVEKGNHNDDLTLSDPLDAPPSISLPRTSEFRDQMNKRVLHLTTQSDPDSVDWPIASIAQEIAMAMDQVIEAMADSESPLYKRFLAARAGKPGFRKLVM